MIYIHIPFCRSHCTYCGFYSILLHNPAAGCSLQQRYVDALVNEIKGEKETILKLGEAPGYLNTLYIGGGTPSMLAEDDLKRILQVLPGGYEEFTMEVNPDDITPEYAAMMRRLGVNRVSMGVQSFDDKVLHRMGRRHNAAGAIKAFEDLRQAGFDNISIDLIFGFTEDLPLDDIRQKLSVMRPEHISCYQLSVEEGSGLEKMISRGLVTLPDDESCSRQYYALCDLLRSLGYEHYEISNWALPGHRSRHNSGYWSHIPYLGFGPAAHSLLPGFVRRWNNPELEEYIKVFSEEDSEKNIDSVRGSEVLCPQEIREEKIMLGLRTLRGCPEYGIEALPESQWFISDAIIASKL